MPAGLDLVQGGRAAREHEVISMYYGPDLQPRVEVAAGRGPAFVEAKRHQLLC